MEPHGLDTGLISPILTGQGTGDGGGGGGEEGGQGVTLKLKPLQLSNPEIRLTQAGVFDKAGGEIFG